MSSRLSAHARRDQLLDVALSAFARAGYHETSMNDVADAAGVTKPVLYQHFESKRELYQALLDSVGTRMVAAIRTATADVTSGRERTQRGFRAYFRWVADHPEAFVLMYGGASRQDQEFAHAVRRVTDDAANAIAPLIDGIVDDEHRMNLAHALVGVSEAVSRRLVERGGNFDADEIANQLSSFAWGGLRSVTQPVATPN
jgi:AcrR family transcriptional regulator